MAEEVDHRAVGRGDFPSTQWSVVIFSGRTNASESAPALQRLCQAYWHPLYVFVRRRGFDTHAAEDLTQSFFAHLFENDALKGVDGAKGKFRSFLLAALTNFLTNEWHRQQTQKRGGAREIISWEGLDAEGRYHLHPLDALSPEKLFERRWASVMIDRVLDRLRQEYRSAGNGPVFELLQPQLTQQVEAGFYEHAASSLQSSAGAVKVGLHRLRRRFGELLRHEVAHTVSSPDQVEEEIRHLLAALGD